MIEFEIDGNIANVHRTGENDGGKVSLFDVKEKGGTLLPEFTTHA